MKKYRYAILPSAKEDIAACHDYLHDKNPDAASRFVDAVQETCRIIADSPMGYSVIQPPKKAMPLPVPLRSRPVKGFEKYLIFYHVADGKVHILRVLHGARDVASILFG